MTTHTCWDCMAAEVYAFLECPKHGKSGRPAPIPRVRPAVRIGRYEDPRDGHDPGDEDGS